MITYTQIFHLSLVLFLIHPRISGRMLENPQRNVSSLNRNIRSPAKFLQDDGSLNSSSSSEEEEGEKSDDGNFTLPQGYNKLKIPLSKSGRAVYVYISLFIFAIKDVDEKSGEIVLDVDLSMRWVDWKIYESLRDNKWKDPETNLPLKNRTLDSEILKQIWKPDVFIDEMTSVERNSILSKLITLNFLADTGTESRGDIVYSARTTLKLRCEMYFIYYPADTQICEYYLRSYSYPVDKLEVRWVESPDRAIYLLDYSVKTNFNYQISSAEPHEYYKTLLIEEKFDPYRRGNYSALSFTVQLRRKLSYHIVQTYLPSVLLIFITWLCFLLPSSMVEARIGISMTTVLTLTAMFAGVREQSPAVSYTMAIDIFMVFCIFIVFLALLTFTLIYWMQLKLARLQDQKKNELERMAEGVQNESQSSSILPTTYEIIVGFTEKYAFLTFALVFLMFFFIYWALLLVDSKYLTWDPNTKYTGVDYWNVDESLHLYQYHAVGKDPDNNLEGGENRTRFLDKVLSDLDNSKIGEDNNSNSTISNMKPANISDIMEESNVELEMTTLAPQNDTFPQILEGIKTV